MCRNLGPRKIKKYPSSRIVTGETLGLRKMNFYQKNHPSSRILNVRH